MNEIIWSVIITGLNNSKHLERCIRSVIKSVEKIRSYEIIYVDAGSKDNSLIIAKKFPIDILITNSQVNVSVARNLGLQVAKGQYIQFIDADIYMSEDWLTIAEKVLDNKPDIAMVCGQLLENTKNLYADYVSKAWTKKRVGYLNSPIGGGGAIRREIIFDLGGYNINYMRGQETELGNRLTENGYKIFGVDNIFGYHNLNINTLNEFIHRVIKQSKGYAFVLIKNDGSLLNYLKMARKNFLYFILLTSINLIILTLLNFFNIIIFNFFLFVVYIFSKLIKNSPKQAFIIILEKIVIVVGQFFYLIYYVFSKDINELATVNRGFIQRCNYNQLNIKKEDISIIVIGKDLGEKLKECFQSIKTALLKTKYFEYELFYIDSNSNDDSLGKALSFGYLPVLIKPERLTAGIARNIGSKFSISRYICFIDGDVIVDELFFNKLENFILNSFDKNIGLLCGQLEESKKNIFTNYLAIWTVKKFGELLYPIGAGGIFVREFFEKIKGYDVNLLRGEETDIGEKIRKVGGKIIGLNFLLGKHDLGLNNIRDFIRQINKHGKFYAYLLLDKNKEAKEFNKLATKNLVYLLFIIIYIEANIIALNNDIYYIYLLNIVLSAFIFYKIITKSILFVIEKVFMIFSQSYYLIKLKLTKKYKQNNDDDVLKYIYVSEIINLKLNGNAKN